MNDQGISEAFLKVSELASVGISVEIVSNIYQHRTGRALNLNEKIKVSKYEEGKDIKFETFDSYSIVVPAHLARGGFNKVIEPF